MKGTVVYFQRAIILERLVTQFAIVHQVERDGNGAEGEGEAENVPLFYS